MADITSVNLGSPKKRFLDLIIDSENQTLVESVGKAISSNTRLEILRFLGTHTCSLLEIAQALELPQSTCNMHINILEEAGLIKTDLQPAKRGVQKMCARLYDHINLTIPTGEVAEEIVVQIAMPIGAYVDAVVAPTCGLLSESGYIGNLDDPATFFEPARIHAQLVWFHHGYIEYRFPYRKPAHAKLDYLELSFEVCSEAPLHHPDWPSDVTVWINQVEVGTWTSPADFGGERGVLTPEWWGTNNTQYGLLKSWKITAHGVFVDGVQVSSVNLSNLGLSDHPINVRIGIKAEALNIGGINLFGSKFGNYSQDILLKQAFTQP